MLGLVHADAGLGMLSTEENQTWAWLVLKLSRAGYGYYRSQARLGLVNAEDKQGRA